MCSMCVALKKKYTFNSCPLYDNIYCYYGIIGPPIFMGTQTRIYQVGDYTVFLGPPPHETLTSLDAGVVMLSGKVYIELANTTFYLTMYIYVIITLTTDVFKKHSVTQTCITIIIIRLNEMFVFNDLID